LTLWQLNAKSSNQDVVFANWVNAAGLWSFIAQVFNVIDGCADLQFVQVLANQAVAVKVKPSAIHRFNAPKGFVRRYFGDVTVRPFLVVFDMALLMPDQVLELSSHRIERISQCHIQVGISMVLIGLAACDQFMPWHLQINANVKVVALMVMAMKLFNGDTTTFYAWIKVPQMLNFFTDSGFYRFGGIQVAKIDLQGDRLGDFHRCVSLNSNMKMGMTGPIKGVLERSVSNDDSYCRALSRLSVYCFTQTMQSRVLLH
jgi:hypothetical protein